MKVASHFGLRLIIECMAVIKSTCHGIERYAMPVARDAPAGHHLMKTHPHIDDSSSRPPLGTYPNFQPVEGMPSQVDAPETQLHVSVWWIM